MKLEVAKYITGYEICQQVKAEHHKPSGMIQPLPIDEWKWDLITMDFVTYLPRSLKGTTVFGSLLTDKPNLHTFYQSR